MQSFVLLLLVAAGSAAKLPAYPSLSGSANAFEFSGPPSSSFNNLAGYLPPQCEPRVVEVTARQKTVYVAKTTVQYRPGQDVVRTRTVNSPGRRVVTTAYQQVTKSVAGPVVTSYREVTSRVNVPSPDVTKYTNSVETRIVSRTATDYRVSTRVVTSTASVTTTQLRATTVDVTVTSTAYDRRVQTKLATRTVVVSQSITVTLPAVTRYTTIISRVDSPPRTTTQYSTSVVTSTRYSTSVNVVVRTSTVLDVDYETVYVTRTSTRYQPTTVYKVRTDVRTTTVQQVRTTTVRGPTVTDTVTTTLRAPRPPTPAPVTVYQSTYVTRTSTPTPSYRTKIVNSTVRRRGQDVVITVTSQEACAQKTYNYDAPSVPFNF